MAFNVSDLDAIMQDASKGLALRPVSKASTAKLLMDAGEFTAGVKTKALIQKMDADVVLQDNTNCGRSASGSTTLSDTFIQVYPIKDEQNFCYKALYNTWYSKKLAKGQNPETEVLDAEFVREIMDLRAAKIASAVEKLIWQGDTVSGTANLNKFDGILKQIAANAITISATGIVAKLQEAVLDTAVDIRDQDDFRVFIGKDKFDEYTVAMATANMFNNGSSDVIFGTSAKFVVTPGLNGTGKIVLARLSDLHLGVDGEGDMDSAEIKYSVETKQWYVDFHFAVGVKVIYADQVNYAVV